MTAARTCVFDKLPILRPVHVNRVDVDRIVAESRPGGRTCRPIIVS